MRGFLSGALLLAAFFLLPTATANPRLLWSEPLPAGALVAVSGSGPVHLATGSSITAYNTETGERLWRASAGGTVSRVAAEGRRVYTLSEDGLLRAFTEAGNVLWQHTVPAAGVALQLSAVGENLLLVDSIQERLMAFDSASGSELWHVENPLAGTRFSLAGTVLVTHGTESGAITLPVTRALDASSGAELWVRQGWTPLAAHEERTVLWRLLQDRTAAVAGITVVAVDTVTGNELAERAFEVPAPEASPGTWLDGGVIVAVQQGSVPLHETPFSHLGVGVHCCFVRQFFTAPLTGDEPLSPVGNSLEGSSVPLEVSWPYAWLSRQWEEPAPLLRLDLRSGELVHVADVPGTLRNWTIAGDTLLLVTEEGGTARLYVYALRCRRSSGLALARAPS